MEKIILSRENIEKNRDKILEAYSAPSRRKAKYIRIAPRKVRVVSDLIKGQSLDDAYAILTYTPKIASPVIAKVLKSAESNAVNNFGLDRSKLYVADAIANPGPVLKRYIPRARGSASSIKKRTSHITIVLKERV